MESCRETNSAMLTLNIWPSIYSRDRCRIVKCEPNWRVSTNQDPSVSAMKLSLAAQYCRGDKHTDILQGNIKFHVAHKHNAGCPLTYIQYQTMPVRQHYDDTLMEQWPTWSHEYIRTPFRQAGLF